MVETAALEHRLVAGRGHSGNLKRMQDSVWTNCYERVAKAILLEVECCPCFEDALVEFDQAIHVCGDERQVMDVVQQPGDWSRQNAPSSGIRNPIEAQRAEQREISAPNVAPAISRNPIEAQRAEQREIEARDERAANRAPSPAPRPFPPAGPNKPATSTTGLPQVRQTPRLKFGGGRYFLNKILPAFFSTTSLARTATTSANGLPLNAWQIRQWHRNLTLWRSTHLERAGAAFAGTAQWQQWVGGHVLMLLGLV